MTRPGWLRCVVLVPVLLATFGCWCLRAIALGEPPLSRLTLVPRYREPEEGREAPQPGDLAALEHREHEEPRGLLPDLPPGEAEVLIAAPESALSVVIETAGHRLSARYDAERRVWAARFFLEGETVAPVATWVHVTGGDRRTGAVRLLYVVERRAPVADLAVRLPPRRGDGLEIEARPRAATAAAEGILASVHACFRHVEVFTPGGDLVFLKPAGDGVFRGHWRRAAAARTVTLRVVAVDRALNERASLVAVSLAAS